MESKLVLEVMRLLKNRPYSLSLREISEETSVPEAWISKLSLNRIKEPSCPRIEALYVYLSGKELNL